MPLIRLSPSAIITAADTMATLEPAQVVPVGLRCRGPQPSLVCEVAEEPGDGAAERHRAMRQASALVPVDDHREHLLDRSADVLGQGVAVPRRASRDWLTLQATKAPTRSGRSSSERAPLLCANSAKAASSGTRRSTHRWL
jgi:hypothetical protein